MQYKKYKLPGSETQSARVKQMIVKAKKDLKVFQTRKAKLAREDMK